MKGSSDDERRNGEAIPAEVFQRFAGTDLDRWRELIGAWVRHRHPAWGRGQVADVRWATSGHGVPNYIQLRIDYECGLSTVTRAESFIDTLIDVEPVGPVVDVIRDGYMDTEISSEERERRLTRYDAELRERRDRERLAHVEEMRRKASERS